MHEESESCRSMTPVSRRNAWGHTTMCDSIPDSQRPGCGTVWKHCPVGAKGRQGQEDLQLHLNLHASSKRSALPTALRAMQMMDSALTPDAVALDTRQQHFVALQASKCEGSKSKERYNSRTPATPVGRVTTLQHTVQKIRDNGLARPRGAARGQDHYTRTSAKCILVSGTFQECLRRCGV